MDFIDQLKQFSNRVASLKDSIYTEEATKTSIIMPFFALLGYDVFNPQEFVPEYTADVGIKKGEKVDYAILRDGAPIVLIEAKSINENLEKHDSQLFRYFGTSSAKFAILTNGIMYRFFTDLEQAHRMDETPFLEINILDIKENQVPELKKFHKSTFDVSQIFDTASQLKYVNEFKIIINNELQEPTDDFVKYFLNIAYSGVKTQTVIEKFRPILKKSLNDYISETMNSKIKSALDSGAPNDELLSTPVEISDVDAPKSPDITTTEDELEAYFIIKSILRDVVPMEDITHKDTASYFNILYKGNVRKWICRLVLKSSQKMLILPDENKNEVKIPLANLYDLQKHSADITAILKRYL